MVSGNTVRVTWNGVKGAAPQRAGELEEEISRSTHSPPCLSLTNTKTGCPELFGAPGREQSPGVGGEGGHLGKKTCPQPRGSNWAPEGHSH